MKVFLFLLLALYNTALGQSELWNLKQYTFYTDLHIYNKHSEIRGILPTTAAAKDAENAYSLGDIYDRKNTEKKDCARMTAEYNAFMGIFANYSVSGNHELTYTNINRIIDGHILLVHGDYVWWGKDKADKFRSKKACGGAGFIQNVLSSHGGKMTRSELEQAASYAKGFPGVDTIVSGHQHFNTLVDTTYQGIRIIGLPRGKTVVRIN